MRQPMQPLEWDGAVLRFRSNAVVRCLLDEAQRRGFGLNELAATPGLSSEDWSQFAQLLGYSVSGWGDWDYVSARDWARAERKVAGKERR